MKLWKKLTAVVTTCALAVSLAACSEAAPASWIAKNDNMTVSAGVYHYYLTNAYYQANMKTSDYSASVFDQEIDGVNGEEWIKTQGLQSVKNLLLVEDMMTQYKLKLSDEDKLAILDQVKTQWNATGVQESMEKMSISQDDIKTAVYDFSAKNTTVFEYLYTQGEKAIPQEDLDAYFQENYTGFRYVLQSTYENYQSLSDEELAALRTQFNGYTDGIKAGSMTLEDAAKDLAEKQIAEEESTSSSSSSSSTQSAEEVAEDILQSRALNLDSDAVKNGYPEEFITALTEMQPGEVRTVEAQGYIITVIKDDIVERTKEQFSTAEGKREILIDWKGDEYTQMMTEKAEAYDNYTLNDEEYQKSIKPIFEPDTSSSAVSSGTESETTTSNATGSSSTTGSSEASSSSAVSSAVTSSEAVSSAVSSAPAPSETSSTT
ncbi:MAG: hypothetical protein HFJ84_02970 [Clostridiales bacterium]|nr:hypothetical protein [Clostridiales bacterium]